MTGISLVITGGGGVGKTSISAALAVAAAESGRRTLVITIDPARRLADALGIDHLGNQPTPVTAQPLLDAAMLDVTASWEAIVHRHAEPDVADRLLVNAFFRAIADRFPAAQAYAAGEQMAEHVESRAWDVVIVDTPPAGGGLDFYTAPRRMRDLVGGRLLRWLTGAGLPGRRALYRVTARPAFRMADSILGGALLQDLAEFLLDLRTLHDGLTRRALTIERHLAAATTVVVTTAQPAPMREARRFFEELPAYVGRPGAVVFNRQLPAEWHRATALRGADIDPGSRTILRDNLDRWSQEAHRQSHVRDQFRVRYDVSPISIPWMPEAPTSIDRLHQLIVGSGLDELLT